jgi:hypothetical protein
VRPRLLIAAAAVALAGCGAEKATTPAVVVPANTTLQRTTYKRAGMTVWLPRASMVTRAKSPAVFRATFGEWYVAGLAYKRKEQLPRNRRELRAARRRLVAEVRRRNRKFKLVSATVTHSHESPAVELVGDQVLDNRTLRTRSLHVYKGQAEYVLEMAAPGEQFATVDREIFGPIARLLRVTGNPR